MDGQGGRDRHGSALGHGARPRRDPFQHLCRAVLGPAPGSPPFPRDEAPRGEDLLRPALRRGGGRCSGGPHTRQAHPRRR
eukprot:15021733-Alexandrium_andersonii.AAC.1